MSGVQQNLILRNLSNLTKKQEISLKKILNPTDSLIPKKTISKLPLSDFEDDDVCFKSDAKPLPVAVARFVRMSLENESLGSCYCGHKSIPKYVSLICIVHVYNSYRCMDIYLLYIHIYIYIQFVYNIYVINIYVNISLKLCIRIPIFHLDLRSLLHQSFIFTDPIG